MHVGCSAVAWLSIRSGHRETGGVVCDECLEIIQMVPPKNLEQVLKEMELQAEAA